MLGKSKMVKTVILLISISALTIAYGCEDPLDLPPAPAPGDASCLNGITDFDSSGPFQYSRETYGDVKMWVPNVPSGCKVPMVHLANGTGATCSVYGSILERLASHGFLALCYEDTDTGNGTQCLEAVGEAIDRHGNMVNNMAGFTGHSQGGGAAFICTSRAEDEWGSDMTYAGLAMEPASGFGDAPSDWESYYDRISSPMFMFNGSSDSLVSASWVEDAFNALNNNTEAYWYEAVGASHIPIPAEWTEESAVVWFRWKLLGDENACAYFKDMPNSRDWDFQDSQNEVSCSGGPEPTPTPDPGGCN